MSEFQEIKNRKKGKKAGITRRDFLKISAAATAGGGVASMLDWAFVGPSPAALAATGEVNSICPYCSVGCGLKIAYDDSKPASNMYTDPTNSPVVDIYGDSDSVLNNGALCSKGAAAIQFANNARRVGTPKYRLGNSTTWFDATWQQAMETGVTGKIDSIPKLMKDTKVANGANAVGFLGSSHATNEANWLYRKLIAQYGTNNTEHQARI